MTGDPLEFSDAGPTGVRQDANYFRLQYQLAAQLLNWGESHPDDPERDAQAIRRVVEPLRQRLQEEGYEVPAPGETDDTEALQHIGLAAATQLAHESGAILGRYSKRRGALAQWRKAPLSNRFVRRLRGERPRSLTFADRRLEGFLASTVEPCAMLMWAGATLATEGPLGADPLVKRIEARVTEGESLSYRVHYNLACYRSVRSQVRRARDHSLDTEEGGTREDLQRALSALHDALRLCPPYRRRELLIWAKTDPSLRALHSGEFKAAFDEELERYPIPAKEPEAPVE